MYNINKKVNLASDIEDHLYLLGLSAIEDKL